MSRTKKYTYRKRAFLMPISTGVTSFILAEVESSRGGAYTCGNYLLTLGDCHKQILLEFKLASKQERNHSLAKIGRLRRTLDEFDSALRKEAMSIEEEERASKQKKLARHHQ